MKRVSKVSTASRRRGLFVLAVAALLVVPAAISWACGPNRDIGATKVSYAPGETVTIVGGNWYSDVEVTFTIDGSTVGSTTTTVTGNVQASFPAPGAPGTYTVVANAVNPTDGGDLSKSTSINVVPAQSTPTPSNPPPSQGGGTTSPRRGSTSPAPGSTSGGSRGSGGDNSRSVAGGRGSRSASPAAQVATGTGVITTAGTTAFAGSVSRAARADAVTRRATGSGRNAAGRPSERSAGADLWSGLVSSKNPSLMPADAGTPGSETGPGLAWALGLLGAGCLALLGLGVAEAQRRRKATAR